MAGVVAHLEDITMLPLDELLEPIHSRYSLLVRPLQRTRHSSSCHPLHEEEARPIPGLLLATSVEDTPSLSPHPRLVQIYSSSISREETRA